MRENWVETTFGEIADFQNGGAFKQSMLGDEGLPVVRIKELFDEEASLDRYPEDDFDPRHELDNGDLIFTWSGRLGVKFWMRGPALLNQHLFKVTPATDEVSIEFLALALEAAIPGLEGTMHGSTMKHITKKTLTKWPVTVPPLEVQRRIVDLIDHIDRTVQAAWDSAAQTRASLEPTWRALTTDCEMVPLSERATLQRKRVDSASLGEDVLHYSIPVLDETGMPGREPSSSIKSHKFAVPRDAVLLSLLNPRIPRIWRASGGGDVVCSTEFAVLEALDGDVDDLYWSVASERFQTQLRGLVSGTTGSRQRVKPKEALSLSVPALGGNRVRAEALNAIERTAEAAQLQAERLTSMRTALLSSLLSGEHEIPDSYDRFFDVDDGQAA